ncbi:MAG TPA: pyridoxal-phosphate dependent enzyme [Streptosporangiaceae bacterium]|nr:pyridoxal-phosphate dependent enzyme [Streptosporangiaceae bacterium]
MLDLRIPSPLERLTDERLANSGVEVWLKRDDLIHADVPGNKWRKLKHNLTEAKSAGHDTLLTFGGAYSNHIRATAAAGQHVGFATLGVIRGEEHLPLNPSLAFATAHGMKLTYLDRTTYRRKDDPAVLDRLRAEFGAFYLIPEGGSNELGARGCAELPAELDLDFDLICCPVGTGATLAGIAAGLRDGQHAVGFSVLKGGEFLTADVAALQRRAFGAATENWRLETSFHFGGYARRTPALDTFIADFKSRHNLELDWLYVAKMLYGIYARADQGTFRPGTRIIAVITGPPTPV